jgi:hypothetical protein
MCMSECMCVVRAFVFVCAKCPLIKCETAKNEHFFQQVGTKMHDVTSAKQRGRQAGRQAGRRAGGGTCFTCFSMRRWQP